MTHPLSSCTLKVACTNYSDSCYESGPSFGKWTQDGNDVKRHGRAILTQEQAQAIFRQKPGAMSKDRDKARILARMYGVSIKTVRDVWVGRTWYRATCHLDHSKPFEPARLERKAGRPKGSKDHKPRSKKTQPCEMHSHRYRTDNNLCKQKQPVESSFACDDVPRDFPVPAVCPLENADHESWTNFPMSFASEGFEDPFLEDWETALQYNEDHAVAFFGYGDTLLEIEAKHNTL